MMVVLEGYLDENAHYVNSIGIIPDLTSVRFGSYKKQGSTEYHAGFLLDFDSEFTHTDATLTDEQVEYLDSIFDRKRDLAIELYPELTNVEAMPTDMVLLPFGFWEKTFSFGGKQWTELHVLETIDELINVTGMDPDDDELQLVKAFRELDDERIASFKRLNLV